MTRLEIFKLRVLSLATLLIVGIAPAASAADIRYVDVARITWNGASAPSVTAADVVTAIQTQVSPNWSSFTTLVGDTRDRAVTFTYGATLAEPIRLVSRMACESTTFTSFMNTVRDEVYRQLGFTDWKDRYLVILSPAAGCIWSGRAAMGTFATKGGVMVLHNTASGFVITHELGHSLGLGHSNLLRCSTGVADGPWSQNCKAVEYGGSIDVMGNVDTTSPPSTYHQWRMGLLESSEVKQSWLNESVELTASDIYGGTRAIFIRDGKSTYWIEYRRPRSGASYNAGLVIFRTDPPSPTFIDSPNPEDRAGFDPGLAVGTDIWMLNLDSYFYSATGRATGSMTLPQGRSVVLHSGGITLEASAASTEQKINVKITRKADVTAPPVPPVTPTATWRYPGAEIIESGYDDGESAIAGFEAQIDGKVVAIDSSINTNFVPTYLDPLISRRAVYVKDLPEGTYSLAIRATDVWGNKSAWSPTSTVTIDRGVPIVKSDAVVLGANRDSLQISLNAIKDTGSNLCATQIVNDDGFVLQSSSLKSAPEFTLKKTTDFKAALHTFDCLGNGVMGDLTVKNSFVPASKSSRTGKWVPSSLGEGALTCTTKCSASLSTVGRAFILAGEGEASVSLGGKVVGKVSASNSKNIRTGAIVDVGARSRVLRITGSNFTIVGIASVNIAITNLKDVARIPTAADPSLSETLQKSMVRYGFNAEDFSSGWSVLPMYRGTTLEDPTLDLCAAIYKSESGRQYRRQVTASKVGSPYVFLSTETVKYKDKAAADEALAELQANYASCVKNKGGVERDGTFVDYSFTTFPSSDAVLVEDKSRVLVRAQIGKGVTARQLLGFYQFKGEMFTGLYVVKSGEVGYSDAEVKRWFDAAAVMAQRLDVKF
ncbi:MAG: hypothetical protein RL249_585 [Actinomycetota bacterium]